MVDASVKICKKIVSPIIFIMCTDIEFAYVTARIILNTDLFFGMYS